ncbi:hypothetical protein PoB_001847700 [Plakobranchus ocellatus]|uniref:Uncharacterized protein n=1 Tax=Plakobranchus ocellatus TaxID=259542 RepID=A0AAV3ZBR4_9GAST|nr:hypothetical protein PoB_001847700 [Plakobranchus ocellatus]
MFRLGSGILVFSQSTMTRSQGFDFPVRPRCRWLASSLTGRSLQISGRVRYSRCHQRTPRSDSKFNFASLFLRNKFLVMDRENWFFAQRGVSGTVDTYPEISRDLSVASSSPATFSVLA